MTLAALLLASLMASAQPALAAQASPQSADREGDAKAVQDQGSAQQNQPQAAAKSESAGSTPSEGKKSPATPKNPKLPPRSNQHRPGSNCDGTTASGGAASTSATPASGGKAASSNSAGTPPTSSANPAPTTASVPANCPPTKVIVRQGGTSEPSIQLAGGAAGSPDRDSANQMLQSAEQNLKKIGGQPLNSNQQEIVGQVRQFVDQSKAATAAGDLERARTLAWKAQTLSEELLAPQK